MNYENYFSDFGLRCFDLLKSAKGSIKNKKLDVTARLCVMSAALVIPHEVLAYIDLQHLGNRSMHPSGTTLSFPLAAAKYKSVMDESFVNYFSGGSPWHKGTAILNWADSWPELRNKPPPESPMSASAKAHEVLNIMRNSLAHGNVGTYAEGDIIKSVMFLSLAKPKDRPIQRAGHEKGKSIGFNYVHTTVDGLKLFMREWKTLIQHLGTVDRPVL